MGNMIKGGNSLHESKNASWGLCMSKKETWILSVETPQIETQRIKEERKKLLTEYPTAEQCEKL